MREIKCTKRVDITDEQWNAVLKMNAGDEYSAMAMVFSLADVGLGGFPKTEVRYENAHLRVADIVWTKSGDTMVSEISTLEANSMGSNGYVILHNRMKFNLRNNAVPDRHDGEVTGWRFTYLGQKYLVIND